MIWCVRILAFLIALPLFGQTSPLGRFSVDFDKGCAPLTVNVTELQTFGTAEIQYLYERPGSSLATTDLTHTYSTPGIYYLVQLVGENVEPKQDSLQIEVFESIPPNFEYTLCDSRGVQVTIDDANYDSYEVAFAGGNQSVISDGQSASYSYGMSDPLSIEVRGVHANAADNCAPTSTVLPEVLENLLAPAIESAELIQICEGVFGLRVNSSVNTEVVYDLEMSKNGGAFATIQSGRFTSETVIGSVDFSATDSDYCVRMTAINVCDGSRINGQSFCHTFAEGDADPIRNLYSTYQGADVLISLDDALEGEFSFTRSFDETNYSGLANQPSNYLDQSLFAGRQYFYNVSYLDTCGAEWNQTPTAPPFIKASETSTNRFDVEVDFAIHDLAEDFTYKAILSGNGQQEEVEISGNSIVLRLNAGFGEKQTLKLIGESGSLTTESNELTFNFEFIIHVPKAFTPNGDGLNDRIQFFGLDGANGDLKIYNRWGQQVYGEQSSKPSWDGNINGKLAAEGIYIYEISIPEMANHVQKGTFALIKK